MSIAEELRKKKKMQFQFHREYLDLLLVPAGLLIMFAYHIFLIQKHHKDPETTVIGRESIDKSDWVYSVVMKDDDKSFDRAVNVISSNTTSTIYLATISLTLCSLIGTWLGSSFSKDVFQSGRIYGDTRPFTIFIKNISLLACLLIAFSGFVQSARHLIHSNYLLSSPDNKKLVKKVEFEVTRGGNYWLFGLRALYFALNMLIWFFGPIPMFVTSMVMVITLYYHDIYTVRLHNIYFYSEGKKGREAFFRGKYSY